MIDNLTSSTLTFARRLTHTPGQGDGGTSRFEGGGRRVRCTGSGDPCRRPPVGRDRYEDETRTTSERGNPRLKDGHGGWIGTLYTSSSGNTRRPGRTQSTYNPPGLPPLRQIHLLVSVRKVHSPVHYPCPYTLVHVLSCERESGLHLPPSCPVSHPPPLWVRPHPTIPT